MDQPQEVALKGCQRQLVKVDESTFNELVDLLFSKHVLNCEQRDRIKEKLCCCLCKSNKGRSVKVRRLLKHLSRSGPEAYGIFIECLRSADQERLADTILDKEQKLREEDLQGFEKQAKGGASGQNPANRGVVAAAVNATNVQAGDHNTINNAPDKMAKLIGETNEQLERYRKNEGKLFVESPSFKKCQADCETKRHTAIFGAPGDGKTTIGLEVLCRVQDTKTIPIIISNEKDWKRVDLPSSTDQELVILFDDMLGKFVLNENLKNFWISKLPTFLSFVQNGKIRVIFTCRETIFCTVKNELESFELFNAKSRIHLSGPNSKDPLDEETQFNIIKKHVGSRPISVDTLRQISRGSYVGFMQNCKVFVSDSKYYSEGKSFFHRAAEFMIGEINRMGASDDKREKYNYCTLACVLVKQGLNVNQIDEDKTVRELATSCGIDSTSTLKYEINKAVKRLTSTYLIKIHDEYQFQHNSWVESVFKSFLESNASLLFKYCKFELIEDLITTENNLDKSGGLCELSKGQYESLFQRLVSVMAAGNVGRVFLHRCFTDSDFTRRFRDWVDSDKELKQAVLMSGEPDRDLWWRLDVGRDTHRKCSVLHWAARKCDRDFIVWVEERLRESGKFDMKDEMSDALQHACGGGNVPVCTWLLSQTGIEVSGECIEDAARSGSVGVVKTLLNSGTTFSCDDLCRGLYEACYRGDIDVCNEILTQPGVDGGRWWGQCLSQAAGCGHIDVVTALMNYGQFTSYRLSRGLYGACERGHIDVFSLLLTQPGVDGGDWWGWCLSQAAGRGNIDVVTALMNYGQFTSDQLSRGLYGACDGGHIDVFSLLLTQPGVDGGEDWDECLSSAAWREKFGEDSRFTSLLRTKGYVIPDVQ